MLKNRYKRKIVCITIVLFLISFHLLRGHWRDLHNNKSSVASSKKEKLKKKMEFLIEGKFIVNLEFEKASQDTSVLEELYDRFEA